MIRTIVSQLLGIARTALTARDRLWSGVWWTEWRLHRNEQRLARALAQYGEASMLVRQLTERHRRLEKGVKYWRPSDPVVVTVLEASERAGASRADLRLLALNRDVYRVRDKVEVRRGWPSIFLAWSACGVVFASWLMLAGLLAFSPADPNTRLVGATTLTVFYWFAWPGFGLYTTRPLGAVARSEKTIARVAKHHHIQNASVRTIEVDRHVRVGSRLGLSDSARKPNMGVTQSAVPPQSSTQTLLASKPPDRSEANFDV